VVTIHDFFLVILKTDSLLRCVSVASNVAYYVEIWILFSTVLPHHIAQLRQGSISVNCFTLWTPWNHQNSNTQRSTLLALVLFIWWKVIWKQAHKWTSAFEGAC